MAPARKMIDITNGFLDPDKRRVILIVIFTSFLTISPVGYHLVVLNVPEKVIQSSLNQTFFNEYGRYLSTADMSVLWAFIVSCQGLGALIGCFFIVPMTSYFGTKWAMMTWNNLILIFGSLIMGLSAKIDMFELMLIGRFLTGVYTGLACALVPIFVYEISPKEIRGALSCFMHIFVCVGSALAAILSLNFILGGEDTWGLLLAFPALLGLIQILASPMLPETPSHLLMNGVEDKALQSIKFYHGSGSNLIETMSRYNEQCSEIPQQWSITDSFKNPKARWGIILGMVVSATQIFCGSMATVSYSTSMFESVSFITVLIPYLPAFGSILSAILTLPALYLVETMGRRKLLLSTLVLCAIADYLFILFSLISQGSVSSEAQWSSFAFAISFFLYGVGYNLGTGPVAYFIPGELVPPEATSASLGMAVAVNWICTMITTLLFYPLNQAIGGWAYSLFAVPTTFFVIFLYLTLPETKSTLCLEIVMDDEQLLGANDGLKYGTFNDLTGRQKVY